MLTVFLCRFAAFVTIGYDVAYLLRRNGIELNDETGVSL